MTKLIDIMNKAKIYFVGTVEELKEYKKDPVMGILFAGEMVASIWGVNDLEAGHVNFIALPFAVDMLSRGAYSTVHHFFDRSRIKYNLTKDYTAEETDHPAVKDITNRIADYEGMIIGPETKIPYNTLPEFFSPAFNQI